MSRSLADPLYERLLRSFPADQDYTRGDWDDEVMPEPVAHFLGQLLRHYSRREARRLRRARSDWVDYNQPEMEKAVRTFFNAVESNTRVPEEEWEDTLRQATYHSTAHLVRPVYVLSDFVFAEREKPLRLPEVLWRMNFFKPYGYLREAIHAFAKKKDLEAIGPDQFENVLKRIDERITADYSADRWLQLLEPLFEHARRAVGEKRMPVSLLDVFFDEKGNRAIQHRLSMYADDGYEYVQPNVLRRLIEEAEEIPVPEEEEPEESTPESAPSTADRVATDDDIWGVAGAARPEGSGAPQPTPEGGDGVPLWKRFQEGRKASGAPSDGSEGASAENGEDKPLWARYRRQGVNEVAPDAGGQGGGTGESGSRGNSDLEALERNVLGVSNPPHRAVYVRQLFGGDETAYEEVLERLKYADSWGKASQIIASDIFRAYKVNIYSDAAVHFTNAVESRFRE